MNSESVAQYFARGLRRGGKDEKERESEVRGGIITEMKQDESEKMRREKEERTKQKKEEQQEQRQKRKEERLKRREQLEEAFEITGLIMKKRRLLRNEERGAKKKLEGKTQREKRRKLARGVARYTVDRVTEINLTDSERHQ